jgi:predicted kinase
MQLLLLGYSIIIDDVNFNPKHIQCIRHLAQCHCTQIRIIDIDTPIEECIRRDMMRDHPVGEARIRELALPLLGAEKAQSL